MDHADTPRQGDRDGRGNLSHQAFSQYVLWFLKVSLDQVTLMASGASGVSPDTDAFTLLLVDACMSLALQLQADAEGASHDIQIHVRGAVTEDDAVEVGRVLGAWGVKGGIRVKPFATDPQALFSSKRWFLQPPEPLRPAGGKGRPRPERTSRRRRATKRAHRQATTPPGRPRGSGCRPARRAGCMCSESSRCRVIA
jgi:hypothetical protein